MDNQTNNNNKSLVDTAQDTQSDTVSASETTATESAKSTKSTKSTKPSPFPKRLIILMLVYILTSVSGLISIGTLAEQSALFCVLTLMMVVAILGRQKAALYLLRAYAVVQLALFSFLPIIMYDPDNLVAGPTTFEIGQYHLIMSDWIIFTVLIALGVWQVWVGFSGKVASCFNRKVNMNIIS
ncbi:hypothetical protein [Shewanella maritima]|uniref:hypothetical protein n=1 Tax=Shewanella maritima TaxID=2520507 RepID=UPI0037352672